MGSDKNGFFRNLFGKKADVELPTKEVIIESAPSPSQIDLMREQYAGDKEKSDRMLEIQRKYENGEYDLSMLTDEEVTDLMYLYHAQVNELKKKKESLTKKLAKMKV